MEFFSIISFTLCIFLLPLLFWMNLRLRTENRKMTELQARFHALNSNVSAICAGTAGVDQRLSLLERQGRHLEHRQKSMEEQQKGEHPYGEAIQRVHQGASAESLVGELGLSHSEADLVVMLHGLKKAS